MSNSAIPGFNVDSPVVGKTAPVEILRRFEEGESIAARVESFNANPARLSACALIAAKINAELRGRGTVTAGQVLAIADGRDRSDSHPICERIRRECIREKLLSP